MDVPSDPRQDHGLSYIGCELRVPRSLAIRILRCDQCVALPGHAPLLGLSLPPWPLGQPLHARILKSNTGLLPPKACSLRVKSWLPWSQQKACP